MGDESGGGVGGGVVGGLSENRPAHPSGCMVILTAKGELLVIRSDAAYFVLPHLDYSEAASAPDAIDLAEFYEKRAKALRLATFELTGVSPVLRPSPESRL